MPQRHPPGPGAHQHRTRRHHEPRHPPQSRPPQSRPPQSRPPQSRPPRCRPPRAPYVARLPPPEAAPPADRLGWVDVGRGDRGRSPPVMPPTGWPADVARSSPSRRAGGRVPRRVSSCAWGPDAAALARARPRRRGAGGVRSARPAAIVGSRGPGGADRGDDGGGRSVEGSGFSADLAGRCGRGPRTVPSRCPRPTLQLPTLRGGWVDRARPDGLAVNAGPPPWGPARLLACRAPPPGQHGGAPGACGVAAGQTLVVRVSSRGGGGRRRGVVRRR